MLTVGLFESFAFRYLSKESRKRVKRVQKRRSAAPIIVTLALLAPGVVAGSWVGYFYAHQKHPATHKNGAPPIHAVAPRRQV
jgi:predicted DNA-binding transcriptional regulator